MEHLYKVVFQNSFDGLCIFDSEGKGLEINHAAQRMTAFSREEFIGYTTKEAIKKGHISKSIVEKVIKTKNTITDVISIRGVEVLSTAAPVLDEEGNLQYIIFNIRDISELNNLKLDLLLSIALRRKNTEKEILQEAENESLRNTNFVTANKKMRKTLNSALQVAKYDSAVLILGESGVGKEVLVKEIHENSNRANQKFVKINCAAIPKDLLESELFGYEKGAFTGANEKGKPGLFEIANGGTVFLDEIGDMPLDLQVKLLRVLQEYEIRRIGGTQDIPIDVRIISATNQNLEDLIEQDLFREDLYYRLNIVPIQIPPLRERTEDITQLAYQFLNRTNQKYNMERYFQPGLIELLHQYDWPGNIREMENMIERLVVTSDQNEISWHDLPFIDTDEAYKESSSLKTMLERIEKEIISEKLEEFKTTRQVAKVLGISQSTVVKKMKKYKL